MNYALTTIPRHTDEELLADLRRTARKIRTKTLSNHQYRRHGRYSRSVIIRRFGTWNKALQLAGLRVGKRVNIPVVELFQNLHHLWHVLGHQPSLSALRRPLSRFGRRPYLRTFGKWSEALIQFTHWLRNGQKTPLSRRSLSEGGRNPQKAAPRTPLSPSLRSPHSAIPWRLRHLVMKSDHFRCRACGASPATDPTVTLHIDHIIPLAKGGRSEISNLQTLCERCNIGKSCL